MSELAKSNMSPVLPRIQGVYRQPEVMNGVVTTLQDMCELMRDYGDQAEQNRHRSGWKVKGKRRRNTTLTGGAQVTKLEVPQLLLHLG
jgi:hypothetical protein